MEFIDALQHNAATLAQKAKELCKRIDILRENGHSADTTTEELIKPCEEIGRLNDSIKRDLAVPV